MSSRKPGYLISVILVATVFSMPSVLVGLLLGIDVIPHIASTGKVLPMPGFGPFKTGTVLTNSQFWQGKFVLIANAISGGGILNQIIWGIDAETGEWTRIATASSKGGLQLRVFDGRMYLTGRDDAFEVVDGVATETTFPPLVTANGTTVGWLGPRSSFVWQGAPAELHQTRNGLEVYQFKNHHWKSAGIMSLPKSRREWIVKDTTMTFKRQPTIHVRNSGDDIHFFVYVDGLLLHRKGLELDSEIPVSSDPEGGVEESELASDNPVSALKSENSDFDLVGWSRVRQKQDSAIVLEGNLSNPWDAHVQGLVIDGQPAALFIDELESNTPVCHLSRFDGTTWNEIASETVPFGSREFRTLTTTDGQRSYLLVTTSTGAQHYVYALESTGLRRTDGSSRVWNAALTMWIGYITTPVAMLVIGIVSGAAIGLLMRWYTKPDYESGLQTVRLASLGWRGIARIIDLSALSIITVAFAWMLTLNLDWISLVEARNLKVDHPSIHVATNALLALIVWLVVTCIAMIAAQGLWGVTPGKWLCRLRTMRTTLRPCGFARSLAREIVIFADCSNLLCWTPGIVCIALTDRRQRLGDLVADTIVVESRSYSA